MVVRGGGGLGVGVGVGLGVGVGVGVVVVAEMEVLVVVVAVDKIWLPPMKIWSVVRDEFVAADEDALVTVPCSDVVSLAT